MTRPIPAGEAGFTIIELLVSLAITGMAAGLLTATLGAGRSVWQRSETAAANSETIGATQALLRDRIGHLIPDKTGTIEDATSDTQGNARAFSFIALPIAARQPASPLRYFLELGRDGQLAMATIDARAPAALARRSSWTVMPLLANVRALDLAYYGATAVDDTPRWHADWAEPDPPSLVRIRLALNRGDPRRWPDLLVRPAASVSVTCHVDPNSGSCTGA